MNAQVQHVNPAGLPVSQAYSQAVVVSGNVRTIYAGGQNGVDEFGRVVAKGDLAAQTKRALENLTTLLAECGAQLEHVVKWTVYIVDGYSVQDGFAAFRQAWGDRPNPPAVTVLFVTGLAHPDYLVEIDAITVLPED